MVRGIFNLTAYYNISLRNHVYLRFTNWYKYVKLYSCLIFRITEPIYIIKVHAYWSGESLICNSILYYPITPIWMSCILEHCSLMTYIWCLAGYYWQQPSLFLFCYIFKSKQRIIFFSKTNHPPSQRYQQIDRQWYHVRII